MKRALFPKSLRSSHKKGIALVTVIFTLTVIAALTLAGVWIAGDRPAKSVYAKKSASAFWASQSGLLWARQKSSGYTTADKTLFLGLNGSSGRLGTTGGENFLLKVLYNDPDNDPATSDTVTFRSTGFATNRESAQLSRTVEVSYQVLPPTTPNPVFVDSFNQANITAFDRFFTATLSPTAHGGGIPLASVGSAPGGDTTGSFTHSVEPGGALGVLRVEALPYGDARWMIHTGECLKWSGARAGGACAGTTCVSNGDCQAREGLNIAPDAAGFVNYFIRMRVRLVRGFGFGVYFRAVYPGADNPATVDFSRLTGYSWQYDPGMGYLAPCSIESAALWSDGAGMLFTRRIFDGSETCGSGCELFTTPPGGTFLDYPFFCPENQKSLPSLSGWEWSNNDWSGAWRTIYIYVFQQRATVWVGREEIIGAGGEADPLLTGILYLDSVGGLLPTGDIGFRIWGGGVAEIDYIAIWENNSDLDPATFAGSAY